MRGWRQVVWTGILAIALGACGSEAEPEGGGATPTEGTPTEGTPTEAGPPTAPEGGSATKGTPRMARDTSGPLAWQDRPLDVGAEVPAFDGLVAGKPAVVVFYRGHW